MTDPEGAPPLKVARFWIYEVESDGPDHLIASGRSHTTLRRTSRFTRIRDHDGEIELTVTRIYFYGSPVERLDPGSGAQVTFRGSGGHLVKAGHIIEGDDPVP